MIYHVYYAPNAQPSSGRVFVLHVNYLLAAALSARGGKFHIIKTNKL